jgi:hypothetical protein
MIVEVFDRWFAPGDCTWEQAVQLDRGAGRHPTVARAVGLVVFGTVNANRRTTTGRRRCPQTRRRPWLEQLVTRRVPPDAVDQALARTPDDIKVVMEFTQP